MPQNPLDIHDVAGLLEVHHTYRMPEAVCSIFGAVQPYRLESILHDSPLRKNSGGRDEGYEKPSGEKYY